MINKLIIFPFLHIKSHSIVRFSVIFEENEETGAELLLIMNVVSHFLNFELWYCLLESN